MHAAGHTAEESRETLYAEFVRRKPFQPPIAVVFDGDRKKFAVLEVDGSLNESPTFEIRQG